MTQEPDNRRTTRSGDVRGLVIVAVAALAFLLISQQAPVTTRQDFGQKGPLSNISGLGLPEQGEHGLFRWSSDRATMLLQPLGYPSYVDLPVQGVRPADQPQARLGLSSMDKVLGTYDLPREATTIEVRLPATTMFSVNPRLDITSTTFQVPGDRRQLGTVFYGLEQRSGGVPSLPMPWPALPLLLSSVLIYWLLRILSVRVGVAIIIGVIWALAIGVLNALARPWLVFYSWYFVVPPVVGLLLVADRGLGKNP